jgi:hypothetical protein
MLSKTLVKIQNPQFGIYSLRYRNNKGEFVGALSSANSFQYVTKAGSLSRSVQFPKVLQGVAQKRIFIFVILGKIINTNEQRKEKAAIKKGKTYTKQKPEEILAIPITELQILRDEFPEIYPSPEKDYYEKISSEDFTKRHIKAIKINKSLGDNVFMRLIAPSTTGRRTPQNTLDYGAWIKNQKKIGLIKEFEVEKEKTRTNKKGKTTTYKYMSKILKGNGSIMFFFTRDLRYYLLNARKVLMSAKKLKVTNFKLSFSLITDLSIHDELLVSGQEFLLPKRSSYKAYKRKVDSICWGMAKEALRLINDDFPSDDEPKGGLTSDDIFTKIKFKTDLQQQFLMNFYLIIKPAKNIPKNVISSLKQSSFIKAASTKAKYFDEDEDEDE